MNTTLVRQAQKFLKKQGIQLSREQIYQRLVKGNFIDKDGNPTQWAFEQGLVKQVITYPQGIQSQEDRDLDEVFSRMPPSAFNYSENPELSSIQTEPLVKAIKEALKDGNLSEQGRINWIKTLRDIETDH